MQINFYGNKKTKTMNTNKILILLAGVLIGAVAYSEFKKRKKSGGTEVSDVTEEGGPAMIDYEAICQTKLQANLAVLRPGAGFDFDKYKADFMTDCIAKKAEGY